MLAETSPERLAALLRVVGWCEGVLPLLPDSSALRQRQQQESLVQPLRVLIGHWNGQGTFSEHFRGRRDELRLLYDYIGIEPPSTLKAAAGRFLRGITNFQQKPLQFIHGIGGTGKSSLIAKLVLDHYRAAQHEQFPWIYLDCDRPALRSGHPLALLSDALEQLATQFPSSATELASLRGQWEERLQVASERPVAYQESLGAVEKFAEIYKSEIEMPQRPLLFVVDTFEEVQHFSSDRVQQLFDLLRDLQKRVPFLRAIVAGRAPVEVTTMPTHDLPLGALDGDAAIGFLQGQGINDEALARRLAEIVGGDPLSLRLVVNLSRQPNGFDGIESVREGTSSSSLWRTSDVIKRQLIQGRLFKRILWHIHDADVRKLAHPGLILRRITPAVIEHVLAGLCKVEVPDEQRAQVLFDALRREVSLVIPSADEAPAHTASSEPVLRFRNELRRQVLPLVIADAPAQAEKIHQAAVRFYEVRRGTEARAEEIYHRLWLDQPREEVEARWQGTCLPFLRTALDEELPPRALAYLSVKANREVSLSRIEWQQADIEDWESRTSRRMTNLVRRGQPEIALQLLWERNERSSFSPLYRAESLIYEHLGQLDRAQRIAEEGLEIFTREKISQWEAAKASLDLMLAAARLREASGDVDAAINHLRQAEELLVRFDRDVWMRLQIRVPLLRFYKSKLVTQGDFAAAVSQTQVDVLKDFTHLEQRSSGQKRRGRQQLLYEMLWVLGARAIEEIPNLVAQVWLMVDLPSLSSARVAELANALYEWDVSVSSKQDLDSGRLARLVPLMWPTPSFKDSDVWRTAWRNWAERSSGSVLSDALRRLLQESAPPAPVAKKLVEAAVLPRLEESGGRLAHAIYNLGVNTATTLGSNLLDATSDTPTETTVKVNFSESWLVESAGFESPESVSDYEE